MKQHIAAFSALFLLSACIPPNTPPPPFPGLAFPGPGPKVAPGCQTPPAGIVPPPGFGPHPGFLPPFGLIPPANVAPPPGFGPPFGFLPGFPPGCVLKPVEAAKLAPVAPGKTAAVDQAKLVTAGEWAQLKEQLGIRSAQEAAWTALGKALMAMPAGTNPLKDPAVVKLHDALYAQLDPRQKAMDDDFVKSRIW